MLANRIYIGEAAHKGVAYPGEHAAIIDQRAWDKAHAVMAEPAHRRGAAARAEVPALLKGLIYGPNGRPMSPSHTRRRRRIYRYYVSRRTVPREQSRIVQGDALEIRIRAEGLVGVHTTVSEIGDAENISTSYVSRILRLALLAPDIIEAILAGRANDTLMLETLEWPLPASWAEQRRCRQGASAAA